VIDRERHFGVVNDKRVAAAALCASVSRLRSGIPPLRQARKPLWLTDKASHSTGNGKDLRCVSIQAYFTADPSRNMPPLFCDLQFHLEPRDLSAQPGQLHLLGSDLLGAGWIELARLRRFDPVAQRLLNQPQFFGHTADAADLVSSLDGLLLELGRVLLLRDALHVVLPLVVSILRRLRWKTKFVGQLISPPQQILSHRLC
jgi:hypothetical protein